MDLERIPVSQATGATAICICGPTCPCTYCGGSAADRPCSMHVFHLKRQLPFQTDPSPDPDRTGAHVHTHYHALHSYTHYHALVFLGAHGLTALCLSPLTHMSAAFHAFCVAI